MQIQKGWDAGVPECSTAAEGVSSDTALLWHGSLLWISTTGIEEREREREREKSVLPYHRCGVMTMSLQFLAQETIGGVSLDWAEIPSYPQRQAASITLHIDYVCFFVLKDDNESRKVTPPQKKREEKCCVCPFPWMRVVMLSAQLNCTPVAPPCSKIGFEREEIAGLDPTAARQKTRKWSRAKPRTRSGQFYRHLKVLSTWK